MPTGLPEDPLELGRASVFVVFIGVAAGTKRLWASRMVSSSAREPSQCSTSP